MVGEVAPLKALQDSDQRRAVIDRIIREYPTVLAPGPIPPGEWQPF
jgi:hypothetical protein